MRYGVQSRSGRAHEAGKSCNHAIVFTLPTTRGAISLLIYGAREHPRFVTICHVVIGTEKDPCTYAIALCHERTGNGIQSLMSAPRACQDIERMKVEKRLHESYLAASWSMAWLDCL